MGRGGGGREGQIRCIMGDVQLAHCNKLLSQSIFISGLLNYYNLGCSLIPNQRHPKTHLISTEFPLKPQLSIFLILFLISILIIFIFINKLTF